MTDFDVTETLTVHLRSQSSTSWVLKESLNNEEKKNAISWAPICELWFVHPLDEHDVIGASTGASFMPEAFSIISSLVVVC